MALLTPPAQRPQIFSLEKAGAAKRFDQKYLGLKLLNKKLNSNDRNIYNTKRIGHSNQGHNFYTGISKNKKLALIEYLKTL